MPVLAWILLLSAPRNDAAVSEPASRLPNWAKNPALPEVGTAISYETSRDTSCRRLPTNKRRPAIRMPVIVTFVLSTPAKDAIDSWKASEIDAFVDGLVNFAKISSAYALLSLRVRSP